MRSLLGLGGGGERQVSVSGCGEFAATCQQLRVVTRDVFYP